MTPTLTTRAPLLLILAMVAASCGTPFEEPLPRRDKLNYPVGLTFHPDGDFAYVVNSNFNARYRPDAGGTVSVIDLDTLELRPENTPYIPSFGGTIALNEDASRAYISVRQGNAVVALEVADAGDALFCTNRDGQTSVFPDNCLLDRIPDDADGGRLPDDPFGLAVYTTERTTPDGTPVDVDVLTLSHLTGRKVSAISLPGGLTSAATFSTSSAMPASLCVANSSCGTNAVVRRPGTESLYLLGRSASGVVVVQPYVNDSGDVEAVVQRDAFALNPATGGLEARGGAFLPGGRTLAVVAQRPDALYLVDLLPADPRSGEGISHRVAASIPLGDSPSDIALHRSQTGANLAYVPCYDDRSIKVVDLDARAIVDEILLDASPFDIEISPTCNPQGRCLALVTLFDDTPRDAQRCGDAPTGCGSVAVIDLSEASARYHQVIKKIH